MFNVFGKIFGSEKALNRGLKALDKAFYTDQEKAADRAKAEEAKRNYILEWQKVTQGQNLARRFIALFTVGIWGLQYVLICIFSVVRVFIENQDNLQEAINIARANNEQIAPVAMMIFAFYFAAPKMEGIAHALRGKNG